MLLLKTKARQFLENPHKYISEKHPKAYKILKIILLVVWVAYFISTLILIVSGNSDGVITSLILLLFSVALPIALVIFYMITLVQALIYGLVLTFFVSTIIWLLACLIGLFIKK